MFTKLLRLISKKINQRNGHCDGGGSGHCD